MEISRELLGRPVVCACGRQHIVPIEEVAVAADATQQLAAWVNRRGHRRVLLVADANTFEACGREVAAALTASGIGCQTHVFPQRHDLLPDEHAVAAVEQALAEGAADIAIAVGSGVINDTTRYASFQRGLPYVVVATAPSMDGYASSVAALQFAGVKTTLPAQAPLAIFADPRVLALAPWPLLQSGFGDLIGKVISLLDWKLSRVLFGEYFCARSYATVYEPMRYCAEHAQHLRAREEEAVKNLFVGLLNSGIAMAMMGNSRPCSGSEHHCSHFWDLLAYMGERDHLSHGLQVGYATHWMMRFYRFTGAWLTAMAAKGQRLSRVRLPEWTETHDQAAQSFYGAGAQEIIRAQREKRRWLAEHPLPAEGVAPEEVLAALQPEWSMFDTVRAALITMGITADLQTMDLDERQLRLTFLRAHELRSRFTVFDFLASQGLLEQAVNEVLAGV